MTITAVPSGDNQSGQLPFYFDEAEFQRCLRRECEQVGRINVAILGKTGVGKSTLVNAVFGTEAATTGVGRPVTQGSCVYVSQTGFLGLVDTRGIEIGDGTKRIIGDLTAFVQGQGSQRLDQRVHVVWYCVNGPGGRFEPAEEELIRAMGELRIPVILVLTKVPHRSGANHPDSDKLAAHIESLRLPIAAGRPLLLCAQPEHGRGEEVHGLDDLLALTSEVIPEGVRTALDAAQVVDLRRKRNRCVAIAATASTAAAAAGASPVPTTDMAATFTIQAGMLAAISMVYGVDKLWSGIAATLSTTLTRQAVRMAAASLVKAFPACGTAVGAAINATVAGAFTLSMGMAWIAVCEQIAKGTLPADDTLAVKRVFGAELKQQLKREKQSKDITQIDVDAIDAVEADSSR